MEANTNTPTAKKTAQDLAVRAVTLTLAFALSMMPISLLSIYSYQIASQSVQEIVQAENVTLTGNLALLLQQEMSKAISLTEAFAGTPGTVKALASGDQLVLTTRLKALTLSFPSIQRAIITDVNAVIKGVYPTSGETNQLSATITRTIEEVRTSAKPSVSGAYESENKSSKVIAISAPISESGSVIGVVTMEYQAKQIRKWLQNIELPKGGSLFLLDQNGNVVAHPAEGSGGELIGNYATLDIIKKGLLGATFTAEYVDPLAKEKMVASFLPIVVGKQTWLIVAEKPTSLAYRDLYRVRQNIGLAGGVLSLLTLGMVIGLGRLSKRNLRLNRELSEKNLLLRESDSIVQTSNDAIIGFLRDGRIRTWNAAAEKMYGWRKDEIVGQSIAMLVPEKQRNELAEMLSTVTAGQTIQNAETMRLCKDAKELPISVTLSPIRSDAGEIVAVSSIDRDITERKKIEHMKDDFISFVSHQLKAPVTAIRWTLEMLLAGDFGPLPADIKKPIEDITVVNAQNYSLISDILNISRIDRGVIAVELKPIPLKEVMERALRDYRIAIEKQGLSLTVLGTEQNIAVSVDKEKMAESVTNSISNAIKHTPKGGITVRMYQEGAFGCIDVSDTGEGMPAEMVKKLFTRDQVLGGGATAEKSAGLGLYIAKHFMEIQGGTVSVASTPGTGTTFTYRIPLAGADLNKNQ